MEILSPQKISQLRSLQGHLQSIRWFIYQLVDRAQPLNKNLHKGVVCIWNEDCEFFFSQIKEYIEKPPIIMPLTQRKPLILYILATTKSLGALLA